MRHGTDGHRDWYERMEKDERRQRRKRKTADCSARRAHTRAMIDAPKLRACPLSETKLANHAGDRPVRTLLVVAASGCVIRRTPTRCPIFFHAFSYPPFLRFRRESFWIPAIGERE